MSKTIKSITMTTAFAFALSAYAAAQGTLEDRGASGAARGSAVQSAPSAIESSKGAVESSPSSGKGFGSSLTGSSDSSLTTPNGNPASSDPATTRGPIDPNSGSR